MAVRRNSMKLYIKWFTFGDSYELDIQSGVDPVLALSILMIIDACNDNSNSASAATQS